MSLYLVIGPPAAGKSTWVRQQAKSGDITIDYDTLAEALSGEGHDHPAQVKAVTKAARLAAIDAALELVDTHDVYVIHSMPSPKLLRHYLSSGAQIITIDPGRDVVLARCKRERPWRIGQAAKQWYDERQPQDDGEVAEGQPDTTRAW